jgi:hypothetical protein
MRTTSMLGVLADQPFRRSNPVTGFAEKIRQLQASSQPLQLSTVVGRIHSPSINTPKPVTIAGVTSTLVGTTKAIKIHFLNNPSDPNFVRVHVHLRLGSGQPTIVASGTSSPITLTLPRTIAPATIFLQAEGNWGPHPLQNSPSRALSLM